MANRGACLHDGMLSVSRFDFGKRPGTPAERDVAFTPVRAAEADVGQAAAPQTLEKSLGFQLRDVRSRQASFNLPPRAAPEHRKNAESHAARRLRRSEHRVNMFDRRLTCQSHLKTRRSGYLL